MAITRMKKLKVIAFETDRKELLSSLLRLACVEVSESSDKRKDPEWARLLNTVKSDSDVLKARRSAVKTAMEAVEKYGNAKSGLFVKRFSVEEETFLGDQSEAEAVCAAIQSNLDRMAEKNAEKQRLLSRVAALSPWSDLDMELAEKNTAHVLYKIGTCPGALSFEMLRETLSCHAAADLLQISEDAQQKYLFAAIFREDEEQAMEVLRANGFSVVSFPGETGKPKDILASLESEIQSVDEELQSAQGEIARLAEKEYLLKIYYDRLSGELARANGEENFLSDGTIVFFEGWCLEESEPGVRDLFNGMDCAYEFFDPTEEDIPDVPVKLKNNRITDALNMVTEMYSLPSYANVDPNPLMAPFFILFYGIMMADMGYGLLMILLGILVQKKYAPKGTAHHLFALMFYCGITTFIMGAVTGGFFGDFIPQVCRLINPASSFDLPHLFTPLNDTMMILIGCMALGGIHILTGMAVSVAIKLRRKEYMSILWNEVTWWVVFAGIALMVLKMTNIVLYVGIALIVIGSGWDKKGFGKVTAIFASLYNNVTGYFGDILSYSRLMALMLAGSVIASVFNTLACIPGGILPFLIISLIGNALNFALNILGCYVHDLRLQCLEFFGKFYEDGGKPFRPMEINTKYVDIK